MCSNLSESKNRVTLGRITSLYQQQIDIERKIFPQFRAHCWLMYLADQGIAAKFIAQLSKLFKGVQIATEYKQGLKPLTSSASSQSFDLHLHYDAKGITLFFRRVFRLFSFYVYFSYLLDVFQCVITAWLLPAKCKFSIPSRDGSDIFATVNHSYNYSYCCCCYFYFWNISGIYITTAGLPRRCSYFIAAIISLFAVILTVYDDSKHLLFSLPKNTPFPFCQVKFRPSGHRVVEKQEISCKLNLCIRSTWGFFFLKHLHSSQGQLSFCLSESH